MTIGERSVHFCIICGREFRPAGPEVVVCPACGGPPEVTSSSRPSDSMRNEPAESAVSPRKLGTEWKRGDLILGEFRIEKVLGEGGFGRVYLVKSERTGAIFAVKRVHLIVNNLTPEEVRQNLMDELRVWMDLPPFPHILPCRFFRTVEDDVVIFMDFAQGGSLKDWIYGGKLYTGGHERALQRILDLAIQFAWGLYFLHCLGYVHQDVKPGNALLTAGGVLQVSDFGLARTKIKASSPQYAAPEQNPNVRGRIDHRTDIWGWGVSVLEMFTGEVIWVDGSVAASVLEAYLANPPAGLPRMPDEVVCLLRKCFRDNPEERWQSALEAAEALRAVYELYFGPFPHSVPEFPKLRSEIPFARIVEGAQWRDPLPYLRRVLEITGGDPAEAEHFATDRRASLYAQAVSDLACYQKAIQVCKQANLSDLRLLADLYANQALVQQFLYDAPGALSSSDEAIRILERLVHEQGRREDQSRLALVYGNKGFQLALNRQYREAIQYYDRAIDILSPIVSAQPWGEELTTLIAVYNNKALAQGEQGQESEALETIQKAIHLLEVLANATRHPHLLNRLAVSLSNRAKFLAQMGKYSDANQVCDRAIALQEDLFFRQGQDEIADDIAITYANKSGALFHLGRYEEALLWLDKAIGLYEDLISRKGQRHLAARFLPLYANKIDCLARLHRIGEATAYCDKAIALGEMLVQQEGRWDLAHELAQIYLEKAGLLHSQSQKQDALQILERALSLLERLVQQEQRVELANDLAAAYRLKAVFLQDQDCAAALLCYDEALQLLERYALREKWSWMAHWAAIAADKSALLVETGQPSEGLYVIEKAVDALEQALRQGAPRELNETLADVIQQRVEILRQLRRHRESLLALDRAIALYQAYISPARDDDLVFALGWAFYEKALVLDEMGEHLTALQAYEQAIKIFEALPRNPQNALHLARAQISRSATLARVGEMGEAVSQLNRARRLLESHADPSRPEVTLEIARACNDQAFALDQLQRFDEALPLYDRAIEIREQLVHQHRHYEALPDLIMTYNNKAFALLHLGRPAQALQLCDKAITLGEKPWSLDKESHIRLAKELSVSYHRKATILARQGEHREAEALYAKSIEYLEPVVVTQGRWEFCFGLANVMANRAFCLYQIGRHSDGRRVVQRALEIIDEGLEHRHDPKLIALRQQIQNIR